MLDAFSMSIPFGETGGLVRGCLDLVSGRFPRFVFGASIGDLLPVFHFHDEPRDELEPKLRRELRPGTRIVSHQFPIGNWTPDATVRAEYDGTDLYLWRVPPNPQKR